MKAGVRTHSTCATSTVAPTRLQVSAFEDQDPEGSASSGAIEARLTPRISSRHFECRATLWVEPVSGSGEGAVILTEIPSDGTDDTIVALGQTRSFPGVAPKFISPFGCFEMVSCCDGPPLRCLHRSRGARTSGPPAPVRRFVVEYARAARCPPHWPPRRVAVTSFAGRVQEVVVSDSPITQGPRVTFALDNRAAEVLFR